MKNRTIIGIICLVLAIIVTFVVAPIINRLAEDTEEVVDFVTLLERVQQYISERYAAALADKDKSAQLRTYIEKYLFDYGVVVEGMPFQILSDKLYCEMAEYSILTQYLGRDEIEEININGWNDIAITYTDGRIEKSAEHFYSPQHAIDIVKRLLHHSGMIIDNATPISQGHLPGNTRITALKDPIVDEDRGISVSIRLLHPSRVDRAQLVKGGNSTQKMIDFLCMCLRYGVSFVVAGATSSGKTTLLNALLSTIPDNKRIFTIESGSRELSLVRSRNGIISNNVVHTLSRPSENAAHDITQEDLVVASLRFNLDIVVVGEMRDTEAYSAVEASLTGHTVVSTIHASNQFQNTAEDIGYEAGHIVVDTTKDTGKTIRGTTEKFIERRRSEPPKVHRKPPETQRVTKVFKTAETTAKQTTQTTSRTAQRAVKDSQRAVKASQEATQLSVRTAQETARAAEKTARVTAETSRKATEATQAAAKASAKAVVAVGKAIATTIEAISGAIATAIASGGWVVLVVIAVIIIIIVIIVAVVGYWEPSIINPQ